MIAEIHHKVPAEWRRREDVLTASFFGLMRYTSSFAALLGVLLKTSKFKQGSVKEKTDFHAALDGIGADWELVFWEKLGQKEIDLLLICRQTKVVVGIEVKYLSGLSSDDNRTAIDLEQEESKNQLAVYAQLMEEKYPNYQRFLLFLAKGSEAKDIYDASYNRVRKAALAGFAYCSWEAFFRCLNKTQLADVRDRQIAKDLKNYLVHKGLDGFTTFNLEPLSRFFVQEKRADFWEKEVDFFKTTKLRSIRIDPSLTPKELKLWN